MRESLLPPEQDAAVASRKRSRTILWLKLIYFLMGISGSTWGRFSAVYFKETKGLSAFQIGALEAVMVAARFFGQPLWGFLADKMRAKKPVALFTQIMSSAVLLLYAVPALTPSFYPILAISGGMAFFISSGIVDAYTLDVLGTEVKARYGEVRIWCAVSWGLGCVVMGVITDHFGFEFNFILYGVLSGLSIVVVAFKVPARTDTELTGPPPVWADLRRALCRPAPLLFFAEVTVFGAAMGVVERGLLFVYLLDMGASTTLCGLSVGVTVILELPVFALSGKLLKHLGHDALLCIALAAYAIRANGYALLTPQTVWYVLFLESLHGLTFACMWIAAVDRAKTLVPPAWVATSQLLLNGLKDGVGGGGAALLGGWVMNKYGGASLYRVTGCGVAGVLVIHVAVVVALRCCCGEEEARTGADELGQDQEHEKVVVGVDVDTLRREADRSGDGEGIQ